MGNHHDSINACTIWKLLIMHHEKWSVMDPKNMSTCIVLIKILHEIWSTHWPVHGTVWYSSVLLVLQLKAAFHMVKEGTVSYLQLFLWKLATKYGLRNSQNSYYFTNIWVTRRFLTLESEWNGWMEVRTPTLWLPKDIVCDVVGCYMCMVHIWDVWMCGIVHVWGVRWGEVKCALTSVHSYVWMGMNGIVDESEATYLMASQGYGMWWCGVLHV